MLRSPDNGPEARRPLGRTDDDDDDDDEFQLAVQGRWPYVAPLLAKLN